MVKTVLLAQEGTLAHPSRFSSSSDVLLAEKCFLTSTTTCRTTHTHTHTHRYSRIKGHTCKCDATPTSHRIINLIAKVDFLRMEMEFGACVLSKFWGLSCTRESEGHWEVLEERNVVQLTSLSPGPSTRPGSMSELNKCLMNEYQAGHFLSYKIGIITLYLPNRKDWTLIFMKCFRTLPGA